MADLIKYMSKTFTFHRVKIEEIENGLRITETFDSDIVESFISFNARPFFRSTNETGAETYQVLDVIGEIYNIPALSTDFILIDLKGTVFIPGNATELIEYSVKLKPFRSFYEQDEVLAIGEITADSSTVTVGLSSTGKNSVRINGSIYDRYILSDFPFIPVVEFTKILIIYAKPDNTVFYLAQGVEALSAVEPDYEGLFVARIIASIDGNIIEYPNYGVITEDSDTVAFMGNGTAGNPLSAESVGGGTGDYIPLTGTEEGKPVTNIINFEDLDGLDRYFIGKNPLTDAFVMGIFNESASEVTGFVEVGDYYAQLRVVDSGNIENIRFGNDVNALTPSFRGSRIFDAYDELCFIQKRYADIQHSYSTTETLTGGTWIDGKPIYTITQLTADTPPTYDTLIDSKVKGVTYTEYEYTKP